MNFFNRAWKYVTRRLSKSILLGLTFFIVGNLILICLGVMAAADNAKVIARQSMNPVVSYKVDDEKLYGYTSGLSQEEVQQFYQDRSNISVTRENVEQLSKDERVLAVNGLYMNRMHVRSASTVPVGNEDIKNENGGGMIVYDSSMLPSEEEYIEPNLTVMGNIADDMIEFHNGVYSISSGRFYTEEEIRDSAKVVLITKELAEVNGLSVGDVISIAEGWSITSLIQSGKYTEDDLYTDLEIIGIYETTEEVDPSSAEFQWMQAAESPKNVILMPATTLSYINFEMAKKSNALWAEQSNEVNEFNEVYDEANWMYIANAIFLLDDPMNVDRFMADYEHKTGDFLVFDANLDEFKKVSKPLDSLSATATLIFWIVVLNSIVIISLVIALTLKTREFEIGVLLSTGASKLKIVSQLFLEMLLVTVLGFTLAVGTGFLLAGSVGEYILDTQLSKQEEEFGYDDNNWSYWGEKDYFSEISQEDLLSEYRVSIDIWLVVQIYALGISVVLLSILVPGFMIMRLNPKQILLN